jgi:hypothetical protein
MYVWIISFIKIFKKGIHKKHKFTTNQMDRFENVFHCDCKLFFFFRTDIYTIQLNLYIKKVEADIISSITASQIGLVVLLVINVCLDIQTAVNVLMFSSVMS